MALGRHQQVSLVNKTQTEFQKSMSQAGYSEWHMLSRWQPLSVPLGGLQRNRTVGWAWCPEGLAPASRSQGHAGTSGRRAVLS